MGLNIIDLYKNVACRCVKTGRRSRCKNPSAQWRIVRASIRRSLLRTYGWKSELNEGGSVSYRRAADNAPVIWSKINYFFIFAVGINISINIGIELTRFSTSCRTLFVSMLRSEVAFISHCVLDEATLTEREEYGRRVCYTSLWLRK